MVFVAAVIISMIISIINETINSVLLKENFNTRHMEIIFMLSLIFLYSSW